MDYTLFESSPGIRVAVLPNAPTYTIVAVSAEWLGVAGLSRPDVVGKGLFDQFYGNELAADKTWRENVSASFQHVVQNGSPHILPEQPRLLTNEDGISTIRYWKVHNLPVLNAQGQVQLIIHSLEEVSSNMPFRQVAGQPAGLESAYDLFMQAPVGVCITRGSGHIVELVNEQMLQFLGRTPEMVGKPLEASLPEAKLQGLIPILEKVQRSRKIVEIEFFPAVILMEGERKQRYFHLVFKPLYDHRGDRESSRIFCVAHDITVQILAQQQLEESRQELRLAIDIADLGTFRLDLLKNKATNSAKVNEWFGYEEQGYSREDGFNPIHAEDRARVDRVIQHSLQSEDLSRHDVSYRVVHPRTGVIRHLRSMGKTLFDENGKPYLIVGIIQDVTEQVLHRQQMEENEVELQRRVQERTIELEMRNQELEQFTHVSHHDLQEPLRKIITFMSMVQEEADKKLSEASRQRIKKVSEAAVRMRDALKDLLDFNSLNNVGQYVKVDLNEIMAVVTSDLELLISEKQALVTSEPLPSITAVPGQMHQLFYNLVYNALKFSRPGVPPEVQITSRQAGAFEIREHEELDQSRAYYFISIQDNGIGFNQEYAHRIFVIFQRLHSRQDYAGTGIGLALCKKVVQNHGGKIWADGRPGAGATFMVLLPAE